MPVIEELSFGQLNRLPKFLRHDPNDPKSNDEILGRIADLISRARKQQINPQTSLAAFFPGCWVCVFAGDLADNSLTVGVTTYMSLQHQGEWAEVLAKAIGLDVTLQHSCGCIEITADSKTPASSGANLDDQNGLSRLARFAQRGRRTDRPFCRGWNEGILFLRKSMATASTSTSPASR